MNARSAVSSRSAARVEMSTQRALSGLLLSFILLAPTGLAAQAGTAPERAVVLTFDDLPVQGRSVCDGEIVDAVTDGLTGALRDRALPSLGLASPGRDCIDPVLLARTLRRWQAAGAVIGNHTATHPDINSTSVADYTANIDRAQALIDAAVETDARWFRPPYLHSGDELEKKHAVTSHLAANGYRIAVVTVDNQEWVYAAVYEGARARGDTALVRRVAAAYVDHLEASMAFYERLSMAVFGREIPQVLLLHANLLNAEQLDRVVGMLTGRGYRFVDMEHALADPAYARADRYVGTRGLSWIQRWALEDGVPVPPEPREADWVAELYRSGR